MIFWAYRRPRGLTLIELMAAAAIASLLMLTLLQVIVGLGRDGRRMRETANKQAAWPSKVQLLLQRDLDAALTVNWTGAALHLEGGIGWASSTTGPGHEPASVVWRLIPTTLPLSTRNPQDQSDPTTQYILVRDQRDLLNLGQSLPARSAVALGLTSMTIDPHKHARDLTLPNPELASSAPSEPYLGVQLRFASGRVLWIRHASLQNLASPEITTLPRAARR